MLKDITLGQYFPGTTVVHRLDPRAKLVLTLLYIVALFLANSLLTYVILFVLLALQILPAKWVNPGCYVLIRYMALLFVPIGSVPSVPAMPPKL